MSLPAPRTRPYCPPSPLACPRYAKRTLHPSELLYLKVPMIHRHMLKDIFEVSAAAALEKNLRTYRDCISEGQTNDASMFEREYIADVRIHKVCVCVCVCTRMYTCTCSHLRTYPFPRLVKKNAILRIVCTGDDIGRTPGDAQIASSSEDRCTCYFYARPQCLHSSPRASSEHSIAT